MGAGGIAALVVIGLLIALVATSVKTVQQGTVAVTTVFGKYRGIKRPGLNFLIPFIERIYRRISVQNRAVELQFQAITQDQANVYFTAMMLYSVINEGEDTIKNVAFKFVSEQDFLTAMVRSVEGSTRGFVATKKQAEILGLRGEIVNEVKENLDVTIETWGYHLIDLQLNDITFDQAITTSMAQVVASNNLKAAATNEGDALLIRKTKEAEAEGQFIRIGADAERTAAQLRGQGVALFREEVARGLAIAAPRAGGPERGRLADPVLDVDRVDPPHGRERQGQRAVPRRFPRRDAEADAGPDGPPAAQRAGTATAAAHQLGRVAARH